MCHSTISLCLGAVYALDYVIVFCAEHPSEARGCASSIYICAEALEPRDSRCRRGVDAPTMMVDDRSTLLSDAMQRDPRASSTLDASKKARQCKALDIISFVDGRAGV